MQVTPLGNMGHIKMVPDQELETLAALPAEVEPPGDGRDHVRPLVGMVLPLPLADIVKQNGQHQQGTILDVGGQDSKAIRLDRDGQVVDFGMNDKCAASSGRYLENMAAVLEISL